jgi:hypothetical protein
MARKKRKDDKEEEEYEWKPPEFDEKAFLKKDMVGTKALMMAAGVAVLFGALAALTWDSVNEMIGYVVYIGGVVVLYLLYRFMGQITAEMDKKSIIGNVALYFMLALGVWILLINKPFM